MANKRSNLVELTRDEPERDEDYQIDPVQHADAGTMAKRKIAKPRSRLANGGKLPSAPQPAANPFAALNQEKNEDTKANPFAGIGGAAVPAQQSSTTDANPFSFISTKPAATPASTNAGPSKEVQRRALNEKFHEKVADLFEKSLYEDWTKALESYIKYAQQIEKGEVKLPEGAAEKETEPEPVQEKKENKPEPITVSDDESDDEVKIQGPQFTLTNPPTMKNSPFSFDKPVEADKEKAGKGFTFTSTASNSVFKLSNDTKQENNKTQSGTLFSFGSDKTKVDEEQSKPAFSFGGSEKKDDKPTFSFGTSDNKKDDKPTFSFGSSEKKDDKPTFSFGSSSEKKDASKPAFTFGSSSEKKDESKPEFTFGSASDKKDEPKPAFSFGSSSNSSESKPLFGLGSSNEKKDDNKPAFSFGSEKKDDSKSPFAFGSSTTMTEDKPKFSFGSSSSTTWSPDKGIKFGSASGDDKSSSSKPAFTFGANNSNTSPFKFNVGGSNTTNESNENKEQENTATDENTEGAENNEPQSNLSGKGPGEEEEDSVYEKKAKVYELVNGEYKVQGVGPLRVLSHKTSKKARILVRAEGSGRIILNTLLRSQIKYSVEGKGQVKVIDFKSDGKPTTYIIRVKTQEDGENLRNILEEHKANA